jgi:hypothetical protein
MKAIRAKVVNGKLIVETPVSFPEGTELQLQIADEAEDDLDEAESAALDASLARGLDEMKAGKTRPADELIKKLRKME